MGFNEVFKPKHSSEHWRCSKISIPHMWWGSNSSSCQLWSHAWILVFFLLHFWSNNSWYSNFNKFPTQSCSGAPQFGTSIVAEDREVVCRQASSEDGDFLTAKGDGFVVETLLIYKFYPQQISFYPFHKSSSSKASVQIEGWNANWSSSSPKKIFVSLDQVYPSTSEKCFVG